MLTNLHRILLLNHVLINYPDESCALLLGSIERCKHMIKEIYLAQNEEHSTTKFSISPDDLIKCYKYADEKKIEVIGIFHSHTTSEPYPSKTDKKFMEINNTNWIIFSNITHDFKAYILRSGVSEIPIIFK